MPRFKLNRMIILIILVCTLMIGQSQSQSLFVLGQSTIRPFAPYSVTITNTMQKNIQLELVLYGYDMNQTKKITLKRESEQNIAFEPQNVLGDSYKLVVRSLNPTFTFKEEVELMPDTRLSIFIQFDKLIYKPSDMVNFRVIVVDLNTRPVANLSYIEVRIEDSEDTSIREWQFAELQNGLFESSMQLPSSPNLGVWKLTVKSPTVTKIKEFEVKQYEPPKFWIRVFPTEVPFMESKFLNLTVESAYTFGKPVTGILKVYLYPEKEQKEYDYFESKSFEGVSMIQFFLGETDIYDEQDFRDVFVNVTLTEAHTNTTLSIWKPIRVYRFEYDIKLIKPAADFRPGLPFPMKISFKDLKGHAVGNGQIITCLIRYFHDNEEETYEERNETINNNGLLLLSNIIPPETAKSLSVRLRYQSTEFEEVIDGVISNSHHHLRIILPEKYKLCPNKEVQFEIHSIEPMAFITYVLVARGVIVDSKLVKTFNRKKFTLTYQLNPILAPKAEIIVFKITKEYIMFDAVKLNFESFENNLSIFLDKESYAPGQNLYIEVEATSDSYVALQAIDQNAFPLKDGWNDLTKANIVNEIKGEKYGFDYFQDLGLFLRSASRVELETVRLVRNGLGYQSSEDIVYQRTFFPESWLWQNLHMNGETRAKFSVQVPDTITSWRIMGFALSPTTGLGIINEHVTFHVEKSFFIVVHLPFSVKRGEVAIINVKVFNLLGDTVVTVSLHNKDDEIEFVEQLQEEQTHLSKQVSVSGNGNGLVSFLIKAKKIGEIDLKFDAVNNFQQDSVEHTLHVDPESHSFAVYEACFIEHASFEQSYNSLYLYIPRKHIDRSINITFNLTPITFPSKNLNRFAKKQGKENIYNFVPYAVALDYYSKKGNYRKIQRKILDALKARIQNQMKYRQDDGSFGFGNSVHLNESSIFVTSLVAKYLKIASSYDNELVNIEIVVAALRWLANKQRADGSFVEIGEQIHNESHHYRPSRFALTAYVLAVFLDTGEMSSQYSANIDSAVDFLEQNLENIKNLYDVALAAYALSLKKQNSGRKCLDTLMDYSIRDKGQRYWEKDTFSTQIASYVILTYIQYNMTIMAMPIVAWLAEQQRIVGGLSSIQDTFIELQALSQYALQTSINDYVLTLSWDKRRHFINVTKVDTDNKFRNQTHNLVVPPHVRKIDVAVDGIGYGLYAISYEYRMEMKDAKKGFDLKIMLMDNSTYYVHNFKVCTRHLRKNDPPIMPYVEVFLPSGIYVKDKNGITDLATDNKIQRIELHYQGTNVRVYYNSLGDLQSCFLVKAERRYDVAIHKPVHVLVYDSANKDSFAIETYEGFINQPCYICQDEDCDHAACDVNE
ncbi:thioester-containing protein 1 allele S3-like isoform X2 [Culex pipiens pallens]|uniref:thioester-containing protein 1 allele S3-like isoform X2 n=1 Tax=Culex pipiens pallens TaxID=42434 RepID=UPI0022AB0B1D|nr:thioester-containing protein 1 allele S3-like isoform X2 [Culex pipiens pallens]